MRRLAVYGVTLLVFLAMDAVWLSLTAAPLYRATLGDLVSAEFRPAPALAFYLLYIVGLMVFVMPRAHRAAAVLGYGALYGVIAYATYDLTNYATLQAWSLKLTIVDMAWGGVVSGVAATIGFAVDRRFSRPPPA